MKLPDSAHTSYPWRIHEIAYDFRLVDVWSLPTPGGPDDFPRLVDLILSFDPSRDSSYLVRTLFAIRFKLGELLGWDDPKVGLGSRVESLRERLAMDLRSDGNELDLDGALFTPLYVTGNEFAAEVANRTVHGIIHLGWVPDRHGGYRGQMAILVKPDGLLGTAYLVAIKPFRYLIVYPQTINGIGRAWRQGRGTDRGRKNLLQSR